MHIGISIYIACAITFVTQLYHYISSAVLTHEYVHVYVCSHACHTCVYMYVYTCINFHYVCIIFIHSIYSCIYVPAICMYDEDCFYYHSWRQNVVIAFGILSSYTYGT